MEGHVDLKAIVLWLLGIAMTLFGFIAKRLHDRVDDHERRHVSREELDQKLDDMQSSRERMHDENRTDLHYIRQRLDSMADRRQ